MWISVICLASLGIFVLSQEMMKLSDQESVTLSSNILVSSEEMTTTPEVPAGDYAGSETTTEAELLYLEWDYEYLTRQEFWQTNKFECENGSLVPSNYLKRKYRECKRIHRYTPKCAKNCEMAITMLLGSSRIPTLEIFTNFFAVTLPEKLWSSAVLHYRKCFDKFGRNDTHFLDSTCEGPQKFYTCAKEFDVHMIC